MENNKQPYNQKDLSNLENLGWDSMRQMLDQHMPVQEEKDKTIVIPMFWRWMAAAIVLLMFGTGYFLLSGNKENSNNIVFNKSNFHDDSLKNGSIANTDKFSKLSKGKEIAVSKVPQNLPSNTPSIVFSKKEIISSANSNSNNFDPQSNERFPKADFNSSNQVIALGTLRMKKEVRANDLSNANDPTIQKIPVEELHAFSNMMIANRPIASSPTHLSKLKDSTAQENSLAKLSGNEFSSFRTRMNNAIKADTTHSKTIASTDEAPKKKFDSAATALNNKKLDELIKAEEENDAKEKAKQKKNVQLALLLNRNVSDKNVSSGNQLYDLPVYPSVAASVKLTKKIGISSGLSVSAPGNLTNSAQTNTSASYATLYAAPSSASNGAFTGTVIKQPTTGINAVNSQTGTLRLESNNYIGAVRQAYYWQIPIMVDFFPINNLRLSAGTDLSFIQKVLVADGISSDGTLQSLSTYNSESGYSQMRGFDPRLSIGAQYQLKKVMLGAKFSRSFQSALQYTNGYLPNQNNQIFNFSLGYRLFQ